MVVQGEVDGLVMRVVHDVEVVVEHGVLAGKGKVGSPMLLAELSAPGPVDVREDWPLQCQVPFAVGIAVGCVPEDPPVLRGGSPELGAVVEVPLTKASCRHCS